VCKWPGNPPPVMSVFELLVAASGMVPLGLTNRLSVYCPGLAVLQGGSQRYREGQLGNVYLGCQLVLSPTSPCRRGTHDTCCCNRYHPAPSCI
jgi:hypothetical protein